MNVEYGAAPLDLNLTVDLCSFLSNVQYKDLPDAVVHEAKRGVLDWMGCALAGSTTDETDKLLGVLTAVSSNGPSNVFGRGIKLGLLEAPIANGLAGHVFDYDDTHMGGVILHTSTPVLSALLALADARPTDGQTLITAYTVSFEAGVRVGRASPDHHLGGWHLTGTLGAIAAGVAGARQLGLDAQATTYAAGIGAAQAAGMQQHRGTMCKSFHAGKAASNGVLAALLAENGFDSSTETFEGKRGFCRIYSATQDFDAITEGLGEEWLLSTNGYKPYACGIVQHPLIDAMVELSKAHGFTVEQIAKVEAKVNPDMIRITGVENPRTGLKSKFSLTHSAAVGYLDQTAGIAQYSDERATNPEVDALRRKITASGEASFRKDQASVTVETTDGQRHTVDIEHASGTTDNPMSDAAMQEKFMANAVMAVSEERARKIADQIWNLDQSGDVRELTNLCAG